MAKELDLFVPEFRKLSKAERREAWRVCYYGALWSLDGLCSLSVFLLIGVTGVAISVSHNSQNRIEKSADLFVRFAFFLLGYLLFRQMLLPRVILNLRQYLEKKGKEKAVEGPRG